MKRSLVPIFFVVVGLLALIGACANETDDSPNVMPEVAKDTGNDEVVPPDTADCTHCLKVGNWYRMTTLQVTSLDGDAHPAIPALNPMWEGDLNKFELNLLFEVVAVNDDSVEFRCVSGARVGADGGICLLEETSVKVVQPVSGCSFLDHPPSTIQVYGGTQEFPKNCAPALPMHAIPVEEIVLVGTHSGTCSQDDEVLAGTLSGMIRKSAMAAVCSCLAIGTALSDTCGVPDAAYPDKKGDGACAGCNDKFQSLLTLVKAFSGGNDLKYTCTTSDNEPAVCLTADYVTTRLETVPAPCQ
jgi:hypothetical protein